MGECCSAPQAREEVAELQKMLSSYERDKVSLAVSAVWLVTSLAILATLSDGPPPAPSLSPHMHTPTECQGPSEGAGVRTEEPAMGARGPGAEICSGWNRH